VAGDVDGEADPGDLVGPAVEGGGVLVRGEPVGAEPREPELLGPQAARRPAATTAVVTAARRRLITPLLRGSIRGWVRGLI
jgi:hypothetical protein